MSVHVKPYEKFSMHVLWQITRSIKLFRMLILKILLNVLVIL